MSTSHVRICIDPFLQHQSILFNVTIKKSVCVFKFLHYMPYLPNYFFIIIAAAWTVKYQLALIIDIYILKTINFYHKLTLHWKIKIIHNIYFANVYLLLTVKVILINVIAISIMPTNWLLKNLLKPPIFVIKVFEL